MHNIKLFIEQVRITGYVTGRSIIRMYNTEKSHVNRDWGRTFQFMPNKAMLQLQSPQDSKYVSTETENMVTKILKFWDIVGAEASGE